MADVVRDAQDGFWRPPALVSSPLPLSSHALPQVCQGCGTEFMISSRFCHLCGATRQAHSAAAPAPSWTRYFEFHHIKQALGLPLASLIAFLVGLGCVGGAFSVSAIYAVENFSDFQAIQLWRIEWLLGAVAAFVAGILLKRPTPEQK
jgi:hypothetical protein